MADGKSVRRNPLRPGSVNPGWELLAMAKEQGEKSYVFLSDKGETIRIKLLRKSDPLPGKYARAAYTVILPGKIWYKVAPDGGIFIDTNNYTVVEINGKSPTGRHNEEGMRLEKGMSEAAMKVFLEEYPPDPGYDYSVKDAHMTVAALTGTIRAERRRRVQNAMENLAQAPAEPDRAEELNTTQDELEALNKLLGITDDPLTRRVGFLAQERDRRAGKHAEQTKE